MAWSIPDVPEGKMLPAPKYWLWIVSWMLMLIVGIIFSIWFWSVNTYIEVFFYGVLPFFFIWLCIFGTVLNRYEQSVLAGRAWGLETERTKSEWSRWSRKQLAVVANVIFSPEENGMASLLGDLDKVPAYPKKARPLFNSQYSFPALMKEIDRELEQQYPGYRHFLHSIYVYESQDQPDKERNEFISQQWDLVPKPICSMGLIESLYNKDISKGLILIITLQDWRPGCIEHSSEFISAQLITSATFAHQHLLPVKAGITRMMPMEAGKLVNDLDMLFEYVRPDKQHLEYVWLLGTTEKTSSEIMQYATLNQWPLPEKRPLHSIDFSFGPPGEMALPLSLVMLADAACRTGKDQLLVNQTPQQSGTLCLITRELYT